MVCSVCVCLYVRKERWWNIRLYHFQEWPAHAKWRFFVFMQFVTEASDRTQLFRDSSHIKTRDLSQANNIFIWFDSFPLCMCVCLCAHQLWWDAFSVQSSWRLKYSWKFNLLLHEYDWLKISSSRSKNWHGEELILYYYIITEYTVRLDLYSSSNYDPIRVRDTLKCTVKYKFYRCLLSNLHCLFLLRARIMYCIITIYFTLYLRLPVHLSDACQPPDTSMLYSFGVNTENVTVSGGSRTEVVWQDLFV